MSKKLSVSLTAVSAFWLAAFMVSCEGAKTPRPEKIQPLVPIAVRPFPLQNVRLLDGPFKQAMDRNTRYLRDLDPDRLLHTFRLNAGLPSAAQPLGGWEEPKVELRGHFVGHFLTACALTYAAGGDEALRRKASALVAELAKCQKALGRTGYLSAFPEEFIDRVIEGRRVWAPWYTLHKIMAGLLDMHVHCGDRRALDVLEGMTAWTKSRVDKLDDDAVGRMLRVEHGGMTEVLANLYAVTGNPEHLALARRFDHRAFLDPLAAGRDELKRLHVNTQVPKVIGAAREYELTGEKYYRDAATYFWDEVVNHRSYVTGGTSNYEAWRTDPDVLAAEVSNATHETCVTYNMLRLTRQLFTWSADPALADYTERALLNGILSTQDPETGMVMYYVPMESGWYKTFCTPNDSFWCCTGTGVESHAKYGESVYFHDDKALFVNLFIATELDWPGKGLTVRQETRFPEEARTSLLFGCRKDLGLDVKIRVPGWAARGVELKINGEPHDVSARPGSYLTIARTWKDGDRLDIVMPMSFDLRRMPDDPHIAAILYGPVVLAGELPTDEVAEERIYGPYHADGKPASAPDLVPPVGNPEDWLEPVKDRPLTFRTVGAGRPEDVTLVPFYALFGKRYALYWPLYSREEWPAVEARRRARAAADEARRTAIERRRVDRVEVGEPDSETAHNLQGKKSSSGELRGEKWRQAVDGGWFSYDLRVLPGRPLVLLCTYWGSDVNRTFDILIDGTKIATQTVNVNFPGDFFDVEYKIQPEIVRGKEKVSVRFQAPEKGTAGGLFGVVMLRER
ncbi:MAG: glycoside hydrolase family 127 protein [Candidatus Aminicenantes bacterium]|nr:glycoside hydrolase family 127 protein [Candidatus Aminicenantes bacterium]